MGDLGYVCLKTQNFKNRGRIQIVQIIFKAFYVLLTVQHLGIIFVNNHLDAQFFFMYVYFYSLHVSGSHVPIIRRINPLKSELNPICYLLAL